MANSEKWRPVVLAAAALIVVAVAVVWPREPAQEPTGPTYQDCLKLANKLNVTSANLLPTLPGELLPALRSIIIQTNAQLYTLVKITPRGYFPQDTTIWDSLQQVQKDLRSVRAGKDPFSGRTGSLIRGYVSTIGGLQGYPVSVPEEYDSSQAFPLVVALHGFGNSDRWHVPEVPDLPGAVAVAPRGFGSTDFKFIGEQDVLDVIEDAMQHYNIDADRVYLVGGSMGGTGCWSVAAHHPDMFAGIAPIAGNTDFRVWEKPAAVKPSTDLERMVYFQKAATSASFMAENLLNVPVYCLHGSDDQIVSVASSRIMASILGRLGARQLAYWEFPGFAHGPFPSAFIRERYNWLLSKRRVVEPEHVMYKTASLRYPGAYWVAIEERPNVVGFSRIDAKITGPGSVEVSSSNVSRFRIRPPGRLLEADQITVTVDGSIAYKGEAAAELVFESHPEGWQRTILPLEGLVKRPGLSGPIEDAFLSRFMVVHGNGQELRTDALANFEARWKPQVDFPVKDADAVTDEDVANYNLVLFGDPASNPVMSRVMEKLPISIDENGITCGDQRYEGGDLGLKMCHPNPLNPQRYVVVLTATGYNGMFAINSRFGNWFHWVVYNNRDWFDYAIFDDSTFGPDTFLEVGFFDSHWELSNRSRWRRQPGRTYPSRNVPVLESVSDADEEFYLSELRPVVFTARKGPIGFDQTPGGEPITDGEHQQRRGLMSLTPAAITYRLDGEVQELTFTPWVPEAPASGARVPPTVFFSILGDGRRVYTSAPIAPGQVTKPVTVLLRDVRKMSLQVTRAGGPSWVYLPAAWLDAAATRSAR